MSTSCHDDRQILPEHCRKTVRTHINTVYVGTVLRIYDNKYGSAGQLATAHWFVFNKLYVTLHKDQICEFVDLSQHQWVVDQETVKPGAFVLYVRPGTNDIKDEKIKKTCNEIRQKNNKVLMNDTLMDYPTEADRETYDCCLFRLTCNCGSSKKAALYTCSRMNDEHAGKKYYGCCNKYVRSEESCNFFVWQKEIEHNHFVKCKCGQLCKKVNVSSGDLLPVFKFVCINRSNKYHQGCNVFLDA